MSIKKLSIKKLSISQKMIISLVLFVITPLIISAIVINFGASREIDEKSNNLIFQALNQTKQNIVNILNESEISSVQLLANPDIQEMSESYLQGDKLGFENAKRKVDIFISAMFQTKPYLNSIAISYEGAILYQYGDKINAENITHDDTTRSLSGKVFWVPDDMLDNRINGNLPERVISLKRVINDFNMYNRIISFLRLSIDEAYVYKLFSEINTWEESVIMMFDQSGAMISSTDRKQLDTVYASAPYLEKIDRFSDGYTDLYIDGTHLMVYKYTINPLGWQVVQTVPISELKRNTYIMNAFIFFAIMLCVGFGFIFYGFQKITIINPLRNLSREITKVKRGQFNVALDIKSQDEIGTIGFAFLDMAQKLDQLIEVEYKSKMREKEAQIKVLESQINPHFLYNTLDSIRWQALVNNDDAVAGQVEALANIFRHVLNKGQSMTTIREEFKYLHNYLLIQKNRFGDKMNVSIQADEEVMDYAILKLIIQPLVENSLIHGLARKKGTGNIAIFIGLQAELIYCKVTDNGVGMNTSEVLKDLLQSSDAGRSLALRNVHQRIQYHYGAAYGLQLDSVKGGGTTVSFTYPAVRYMEGRMSE